MTAHVEDVSPAQGLEGGGTTVWILGRGFTGATNVRFGGTNAASFSVINDAVIEAVSPAHAGGTITVSVVV